MKAQLNNKKFSRIKFNKYKIFYSTFLILSFLLFFLLGTWSEKYDFNKKVKLFLNDLSETIENRVY